MTTLKRRTEPDFYTDYVDNAVKAGVPRKTADEAVRQAISEARSLLDGVCPKCGEPSARYVDYRRQQGATSVSGVWVQYRCSTAPAPGTRRPEFACDYMWDVVESEASN